MKKRIGIVGEGPTDYLVLKCMIDQITGEENDYLRIQPEQNMLGEYGNGGKVYGTGAKPQDRIWIRS